MLEWLKRHAWKACIRQNRISGSNPDLSARKSRTPRPGIFFSTKLILSLCKLCKQRKSLVDRVIPKRGRWEVFLVSTGRAT